MEKITKNFTKLTHKGVSLIVLIVTIIVIVILAATIILTLSKNNPIEIAKEARFKEDVRTFQDELALAISKNVTAGNQKDEKITELDFEKIKEYISIFSEKYRDKIVIQDNELRYTDKIDEKEKEWLKELNIAEKKSLLPEGYTELEFIESTGTQYIDTGYTFNGGIAKIEFKVEYTNFVSSYNYLIGTQIGTSSTALRSLCICFKNDNTFNFTSDGVAIDINNLQRYNSQNLNQILIGDYYQDDDNKCSIASLNGIEKKQTYSGSMITGETELLFCKNTSGNKNEYSCAKLYYFRIYENFMQVRNFIPCYRKSDNEIGMYDIVNNKFYTNQGTGEFLYKEKE